LFLREDGQVARIEELNSYDDGDAHRDAVRLFDEDRKIFGL